MLAVVRLVSLDNRGLAALRQEYFDLCFHGHGGWNHDVIDGMPTYWRKWYHRKLVEAVEDEKEFEAAIHGMKLG